MSRLRNGPLTSGIQKGVGPGPKRGEVDWEGKVRVKGRGGGR